MSIAPPGLGSARDPVTQAINDLRSAVEPVASTRQRVGDSIQLLDQTASIATANLITRARNAIYVGTVFVQTTTADALSAATVLATIGWTDRAGATTAATTALAANVVGRQKLAVEMQVQPDTNITYATTVTGAILTAKYAVEIKLERIA